MPFGLINSSCTSQLLMGLIGEKALVHLDGIIVFSSAIEQHAERLDHVLKRLETTNLYTQLLKCVFSVEEVEYSGHVVSRNGILTDPKKVLTM